MRVRNLIREAAITVVFTYLLLIGGTLNGLVLYEAINLSLALLGLIGIAWLGQAWWRRQPIVFSPVTLAWGLFLAVYAVTGVFSVDPRRSLNSVCLMLVYALVWVLVSDLISKGWPAELFMRVILVLATGIIALALWQVARYGLDWLEIRGNRQLIPPLIVRPHPLLGHSSMVAFFLNMLWPVALVALLGATSWSRRVIAAIWILLNWSALLVASSRAAWLGTAVAVPVTLGLWWLTVRKGHLGAFTARWRLSTGWFVAGIAVVLLIGGLAAAWIAPRAMHGAFGLASRLHFWEAAWEAFVARPLTGLGPGTFATAYVQYASVPPQLVYLHGHSQIMHLLAESGLLGIVGAGVLVGTIVWVGWRHWRMAAGPARRSLAGVIGGLVTAAVHSFFDAPTEMPVNMMVVAVLLAILTTPVEPVKPHYAHRWRLVLTLLIVGLLAIGVWSQFAYRPYVDGVILAEVGNWEAAAPRLEQAVARDPGHAFYNLISGYVHGVLADRGNADALPTAIRRYEAAIEREPGYALNYANLATLYWQQGDTTAALAAAERATMAAPLEATFWLNLGFYREETGDLEGAQEAYNQTLTLRPKWSDAYYWRSNDFRRSVLAAWRIMRSAQEPETLVAKAWAALDTARYEEAVVLFDEALAAEPRWVTGYALRAEALMNLGHYQEAAYDAHIAGFLRYADPQIDPAASVYSNWVLARIAYHQGDLDAALLFGERALDGYRKQSIFGPGAWGHTNQAWSVAFHRLGISADMLPRLVTIRFPDQQVAWLETVGRWYEEASDLEAARRLYREALEAAPDTAFAAERLAAIGDE